MYSYYFYYEAKILSEFTEYKPEIRKGIFRAEGTTFASAGEILDKYYGEEIQEITVLKPISDCGVIELTDENVADFMKQLEDF